MGIRQTLNEHSRLTAGVVATVAFLATAFVVMQVFAGRKTIPTRLPASFFSDDDGKTFFVGATENVAPFDHSGKTAVQAYVFECCGKRFVGYLDRYNADAHKLKVSGKGTRETEMYGHEVKKPGSTAWVKSQDLAAASAIVNVTCPHGANAQPEPVEP